MKRLFSFFAVFLFVLMCHLFASLASDYIWSVGLCHCKGVCVCLPILQKLIVHFNHIVSYLHLNCLLLYHFVSDCQLSVR